jgi:hypothetical protein
VLFRSFLWATIIFLWTFVLGNIGNEAIGAYEIVGSVFFFMICSSYLVVLGRKVVRESPISWEKRITLLDRGSVCFPWLTIMSCVTIAWALSTFVTGLIPIKYSYTLGSTLFLPMFVIVFMRRKDLRPFMLVFGIIGIPAGCLTEYFYYGRDWWHAERVFPILDGRLGPADVIYSFFHGALLPVSGLFLLQKKVNFIWKGKQSLHNTAILGVGLAVFIVGAIYITTLATKLPSFYVVSVVFASIGLFIIYFRRDLWLLSVMGAVLTLCWSAPVFFIVNTVSPGWIESFWISNTGAIRILGFPLFDLLWYAAAGFGAGPIIPFLLKARIASIDTRW